MKIILCAAKETAMRDAVVSAFILYVIPSFPRPIGETTGKKPCFSKTSSSSGLTFLISPTKPKSMPLFWGFFIASIKCPSLPLTPTALPPKVFRCVIISLFIVPESTISATFIFSELVTLRPSIKETFWPNCSIAFETSWPPPWTITGSIPNDWSKTISWAKSCLRCSSIMAAPPYLMTTILPLKLFM